MTTEAQGSHNPQNAAFPARTAAEYTFPTLGTVWVQTLSDVLRDKVWNEANRYAGRECLSLRKGQPDYTVALAEWKEQTPEAQAAFLAKEKVPELMRESFAHAPNPVEPERGDLSEDEYTAAYGKWEAECVAAGLRREKFYKRRFEQEVNKGVALSAATRVARCMDAYFREEFGKAFGTRWEEATIRYAVRQAENHNLFVFGDIQEVVDLSAAARTAILEAYAGLDTVTTEEVPTSPAV
jgi:hypothetical protein